MAGAGAAPASTKHVQKKYYQPLNPPVLQYRKCIIFHNDFPSFLPLFLTFSNIKKTRSCLKWNRTFALEIILFYLRQLVIHVTKNNDYFIISIEKTPMEHRVNIKLNVELKKTFTEMFKF